MNAPDHDLALAAERRRATVTALRAALRAAMPTMEGLRRTRPEQARR